MTRQPGLKVKRAGRYPGWTTSDCSPLGNEAGAYGLAHFEQWLTPVRRVSLGFKQWSAFDCVSAFHTAASLNKSRASHPPRNVWEGGNPVRILRPARLESLHGGSGRLLALRALRLPLLLLPPQKRLHPIKDGRRQRVIPLTHRLIGQPQRPGGIGNRAPKQPNGL